MSSHSSVITSTEYLLGLRTTAPTDLILFATMDHSGHGDHLEPRGTPAPFDPLARVTTTVPVRMTAALNRHTIIGAIVADRAKAISEALPAEAVILVAHGPVPDEDNRLWLEDMAVLATHVAADMPFASVEYMTVRDDAGPEMRAAATSALRANVRRQIAAGRRVLIVPHLLSYRRH